MRENGGQQQTAKFKLKSNLLYVLYRLYWLHGLHLRHVLNLLHCLYLRHALNLLHGDMLHLLKLDAFGL